MFRSSGELTAETYDVCVVGAGPAGLTVALTLAERGRRVLVFESGGEPHSGVAHSETLGYGHYSGEYWNVHSVRALGGSSNVWSGWCTIPSALDFDNPAIGVTWPLRHADLLPYWRRAAPLLDHHPDFLGFETPLVDGFVYRPIPTSVPTRFAEKHHAVLAASAQVDVRLGCTVVAVGANAARSAATSLACVDRRTGGRHEVTLSPRQHVVLAAGGIGNAQMLLQPPHDGGVPVGNETGQAGRYLMEHPHFHRAGECVLDTPLSGLWPRANPGAGVHALVAGARLSVEHGLVGCSLQCSRESTDHPLAQSLSSRTGRPFYHYGVTARAEMRPSPENRVFVTGERDRFGLVRVGARTVLEARDFVDAERTMRLLGEALIRLDRGRVRVNNDRIYKGVAGGGHIMGTTRMGTSRASSVVDPDCRVHGYANLFVAGSSVFPTGGGYAHPTITIVALALRLADTLVKAR